MWIKLLVSGAVIAFCIFLGYLAAGKYRSRKKFFTQFHSLNERYLTELGYMRRTLDDFFAEFSYEGDFEKASAQFRKERKISYAYAYLTEDEKKFVQNYFSMMGKGDSHAQNGYFNAQKSALEGKKSASEREAKERGDLYLKLGLLAGLALVILIV